MEKEEMTPEEATAWFMKNISTPSLKNVLRKDFLELSEKEIEELKKYE